MITEYDNRQLVRMRERLDFFTEGGSSLWSLGPLIGDLEVLLSVMESMDAEWKEKAHEQVGILEEVYAIALDEEARELDKADRLLVSQSVRKISEYLSESGI